MLDGPRHSVELERAREIRPMIDTADVVLDLHSMLWPSDPLILCGETAKGRALAAGIGAPELVVADHGHASGRRILDYARFAAPDTPFVANLVEAGQHWQPATVDTMMASIAGLLRHFGMAPARIRRCRRPRHAAAFRRGDDGGGRRHQQLRVCAGVAWRGRGPAPQHADRDGRRRRRSARRTTIACW